MRVARRGGSGRGPHRQQRRDEHDRGDAAEHQAAAVGHRRVLAQQPEQRRHRHQSHPEDRPPHREPDRRIPGPPRGGPREGQRRTEHQPHDVRVGAVVDPGGVLTRHVQEGHQRGGQQGDTEGHAQADRHSPTPQQRRRHDRGHDQGPDEVELLLHGERPEVHEQLRRGLVEVARAGRDLDPVGREGQRAEDLPPDVDDQVVVGHPRGDGAHHDADDEGGDQPPGTPGPEPAEGDPAVSEGLTLEQRGDEEPGDDEEDVHPEEAAGEPRGVEVVDEHRPDGEGAQPVEAVEMGRGRGGRTRIRGGGRARRGALQRRHRATASLPSDPLRASVGRAGRRTVAPRGRHAGRPRRVVRWWRVRSG